MKDRSIGLMLAGGRSPHTAICAMDYFHGQGRLFIVESFVGKKEKKGADLDATLVERLQNLMEEKFTRSEIITNAPLSLPPCYNCKIYRCPGKDYCEVPETTKIMELYDRLKQKRKNLRKFTPYTQRFQDVWIREAVPEISPPHETMGANMAPLTSRMIHIKKMLPGVVFKETYPLVSMYRLLPALELPLDYVSEYKDISAGKRVRSVFLKKLEQKASVFIYDNDIDLLINSSHLFDSLILAVTGVMGFLGKVEIFAEDCVIPQNNTHF